MAKKKSLLVFMDVSIDGDPVERMVFEVLLLPHPGFQLLTYWLMWFFPPKKYKLAARINWMNLQLHSFSLILLPRLQKIFEHFVQVTRVQSLLLLHFCSWYSYIRDLSGVINPFFSVLLIFFYFFINSQGRRELVLELENHCTTRGPFSIVSLKVPWLRFVDYLVYI